MYYKMTNINEEVMKCVRCQKLIQPKEGYDNHEGRAVCSPACSV